MATREDYPLHGGQLRQIAERLNTPIAELLDFSANINPSGPPPSVIATLRASLDDPSTLTEYPDLRQTDLKYVLACYARARPENVIVGNGFVPLLEAALRTLKIRSCLLPVPAFIEYRKTLERAGVEIFPYTLTATSAFRYDAAALLAGQYDAVLLANPQNPSGVCLDFGAIRDLVEQADTKDIYVLLDEAFIDYVPEYSLTTIIHQFPKLILFRSVTKFHGIPGLRVAYAISSLAIAKAISDSMAPWPVTTLAAHAVAAALDDHAYAIRSRSENLVARIALQAELESCGLTVYPSAANFLLFQLPTAVDAALFWHHMISDHRIVLRSCANYEGLADGHFRVAVRKSAENDRLVAAVRSTITKLTRARERKAN